MNGRAIPQTTFTPSPFRPDPPQYRGFGHESAQRQSLGRP